MLLMETAQGSAVGMENIGTALAIVQVCEQTGRFNSFIDSPWMDFVLEDMTNITDRKIAT